MPKYNRSNNTYKTDHGPECEALVLRIRTIAESLRGCVEAIKKKKKEFKKAQRLFEITCLEEDKINMSNIDLTIQRMGDIHRLQVSEQIELKTRYTQLYQHCEVKS